MIALYAFAILLLLGCGLAVSHGGRDERWGATITLAGALLTPLVQATGFLEPEIGILAVDLMLFLMLGQLALLSDRYWPLAACAFHTNTLMIHLVELLYPGTPAALYADGTVFWSYLVQISLIAGILVEGRKSRA